MDSDLEEFIQKLVEESTVWVSCLTPEKRAEPILIWDGKAYSPNDILEELKAKSEFSISYINMMYDSHIASAGNLKSIGTRSLRDNVLTGLQQ